MQGRNGGKEIRCRRPQELRREKRGESLPPTNATARRMPPGRRVTSELQKKPAREFAESIGMPLTKALLAFRLGNRPHVDFMFAGGA
ncbi:MAG TPA: hypothetical protein VHU79_02725, partial [Sphingomicrobium sp.]|nr:hypothetical protein [Sphingomicrobium sp.]